MYIVHLGRTFPWFCIIEWSWTYMLRTVHQVTVRMNQQMPFKFDSTNKYFNSKQKTHTFNKLNHIKKCTLQLFPTLFKSQHVWDLKKSLKKNSISRRLFWREIFLSFLNFLFMFFYLYTPVQFIDSNSSNIWCSSFNTKVQVNIGVVSILVDILCLT